MEVPGSDERGRKVGHDERENGFRCLAPPQGTLVKLKPLQQHRRTPARSPRAHALARLNWPRTRTGFFSSRLLHLVLSFFNAGKKSSDSGAQVICSD
jgi:hypothetical protein